MSNSQSLPKLRVAGHLEKFSTTRHALGLYNNITLSAYYSIPESHTPLESLIYRALAQVIAHHPALSAVPVDEDKPSAYFVRLSNINLRQVVTFVDRQRLLREDVLDADLGHVLEHQHNTDFKDKYGQLPFWRLVILREPTSDTSFVACFVFHHAIGDGQSGLEFHRSLHAALVDAESALSLDKIEAVVVPPDKPMIPCLEDLHKLPLSLRFILSALKGEFFPNGHRYQWTGKTIDFAEDERKRQFTYTSIPPEKVASLLSLTHQHAVTLTALLEAVLAHAVFARLPNDYTELCVDGAVSLKRFIPALDDDSLGTYVSRYMHDHHRSRAARPTSASATNGLIWREAQSVKRSIDAELSKKGKDSIVGLLRWAGPLLPFFKKRDGRPREESFELSNIGVFKYARAPSDGSWKIDRIIFGQSADVCGAPFAATVVTAGNGCLTVGFAWMEAMFDASWMEQLVTDFRARVIDIAEAL